jgi:hypothetical protein
MCQDKAPVIIYWCFSCGRIMAKEYALSFYRSKAWERCRAGYISKRYGIDGGMCERCRKEPGYIVHHKIHITPMNINNPDITLNERNLQFVCKKLQVDVHGLHGCNLLFCFDGCEARRLLDLSVKSGFSLLAVLCG